MHTDKMMKHPNTTRENKPLLNNKNLRIANNSSSNNTTSNNFFQMKKLMLKKNYKNKKVDIELIKKNILQKLRNNLKRYDSNCIKINIKTINDIIYDERKHIVSVFKDYLFWDENSDFLKRFYKLNESIDRMPRISAYYQTYTLIKPIYFKLECYKLISKNLKRHKKRLENLEEKISKNNVKRNNNNSGHEENNKIETNINNFSKIVKSHFIKSENLIDLNNNKDNDNFKDYNVHLKKEKNNNEYSLYLYEEINSKNFEIEKNIHGKDINFNGIKKMIKLKDDGNKYNIEKFNLEVNRNENKIITNEENIINDKVINSFSFLEIEKLIDLKVDYSANTKSQAKIQPLRILQKFSDRDFNNYNITEISNNDINIKKNIIVKRNNYIKNGKKNVNNYLIKRPIDKDSKTFLKEKDSKNNNSIQKQILLTKNNEETEYTKHSLFLDEYSIILPDNKDIKFQIISKNYINLSLNYEHSFMVNNIEKNIKEIRNEKNKINENSVLTIDTIINNKHQSKIKEAPKTMNSKEKEKLLITYQNKISDINIKKENIKDSKKINIPILNLKNINNLINSENLNFKTGKIYNINNNFNKQSLESRKNSEPVKNDKCKINNNNIHNKENLKLQSQIDKNLIKRTQKNFESIHKPLNELMVKDELNNQNSQREIENKFNQNFKIIENMIQSIKMNNLDGLINIINSKSKTKNKALTSRERDRGDIDLLQDIYSRNSKENKLNNNFANIYNSDLKNTNDIKKIDNFNKNETQKKNSNNNFNDQVDCEEKFLHEKNQEIYNNFYNNNNVTEPNLFSNQFVNKKNDIKQKFSNNHFTNQIINLDNTDCIHSKGKEKHNKGIPIFKNALSSNRNLISKDENKNNIKNNKIIQIHPNNLNLNNEINNNPSSIYNINLNLNLNLNVKMDNKIKNLDINNKNSDKNHIENIVNQSDISKNNYSQTQRNIINLETNFSGDLTQNHLLNKEKKIIIKKETEEKHDKYNTNLKSPKILIYEPGSVTERGRLESLKLNQTKCNKISNELFDNNYINTEDNLINYSNKFEKLNFVNKLSDKITEKFTNMNYLINGDNLKTPHHLSRKICISHNSKLNLGTDKKDNNNQRFPTHNNNFRILSANVNPKKSENFDSNENNSNNNKNFNTINFTKQLIEEEKKSRNIKNNNLIATNILTNNNNNSHLNNNYNKGNTLCNKIKINQPLTHRLLEVNKHLDKNLLSDNTNNLRCEKKVVYKSEKNRILNPLLNLNTNTNPKKLDNYNINQKNQISTNINVKRSNNLPINKYMKSSNINIKHENENHNKDKIHIIKNEGESRYHIISNNNLFKRDEKLEDKNINFNNSLYKEDNNHKVNNFFNYDNEITQNYESINNNNIHKKDSDTTKKCQKIIDDEIYLKIIENTKNKFNSNSRNYNLKNLILFNDTTLINKNSNFISLKNTENNCKNNYTNNTARENSTSNNFNLESYLIYKKENSGTHNKKFSIFDSQNKISNEKSKINTFNSLNSQNFNSNESKIQNSNQRGQKSIINNYNCKNNHNIDQDIKLKIIPLYKNEKNEEIKNQKALNKYEINLFNSGKSDDNFYEITNNFRNNNIMTNLEKQKIVIPTLNLKDIKRINNEEYFEIEERKNLSSARNIKYPIKDFLSNNENIATDNKYFMTLRNDKNKIKNEIINLDLNSKKGIFKNLTFLK